MGSHSYAELDALIGSTKEAASVPLPPSLSLNSTIYSIQTEYCDEGRDLRDDTHRVGMSMDSMREGAEGLSALPHCKSSMSVLTEYRSKASDVAALQDKMTMMTLSDEAEVSLSRSSSTQNSRPVISHSRSSLGSKLSNKSDTNVKDQIPLISKSMSSVSRKSSKGGHVTSIPLALTKSRSSQTTKSSSSKQARVPAIDNFPLSSSRSNSSTLSTLPAARTTSTLSVVTQARSIEKSSSKVETDQMPFNISKSMSSVSRKSSKGGDATFIPLALTKSQSTQSTKSRSSKHTESVNDDADAVNSETAKTDEKPAAKRQNALSPMFDTALEGDVLWRIMNQEMSYDLNDGVLMPAQVPPVASKLSSSSTETPAAVAEDVQNEVGHSRDAISNTSSSIAIVAENTKLQEKEEVIWDNSIEVSYSDLDKIMSEIEKEEGQFTDCPTSPRKKIKWSKVSKILAGKSRSVEKKLKSKSILKRFQKKKLGVEQHQNKASGMQHRAIVDTTTNVERLNEEGVVGEFEYSSIEKSFKDKDLKRVNEEKENDEVNGEEIEFAVEPSSLPWNSPDAFGNNIVCSQVAWDDAMCNFQEAKAAVFALTDRWKTEKGFPDVRLDESTAKNITSAAKQLYAQRELIRIKSANLKVHGKPSRGAQAIKSYQALVKDLSDAKRLEDEFFTQFKTLFNLLSMEERVCALRLGGDVARAGKEVAALHCDAVVEIEMSLPGCEM